LTIRRTQGGDLPGVLGRLALGVVEVRRHRDHGLLDRVAKLGLGVLAQLLQDHRGDLGRRVLLAAHDDATSPFAAFVTLYGTRLIASCTTGSSNLRPMKRLIEKTVFSGLVTACRRAMVPTRRCPVLGSIATTDGVMRLPSALLEDRRLARFEDRHRGVRRPKINADDLRHGFSLQLVGRRRDVPS
jgi:hypothetical protein